MEIDTTPPVAAPTATAATEPAVVKERDPIPEVEVYVQLLVTIFLLDQNRLEEAAQCSELAIERVQSFNRSSLNLLSARVYFYYSRSYELIHKLDQIRP